MEMIESIKGLTQLRNTAIPMMWENMKNTYTRLRTYDSEPRKRSSMPTNAAMP